MADLTPRLGLKKPKGADQVTTITVGPHDIRDSFDVLDAAVVYGESVHSARPAAAVKGRIWRSTDTGEVAFDTGATWMRLAVSQVPTGDIADGAVTTGKLADGAVVAAKIAAGQIDTGKLADGAVNHTKIFTGSISSANLGNGIVTAEKLASKSSGTVGGFFTNWTAVSGKGWPGADKSLDGLVTLRGSARRLTGDNKPIVQLPSGFRPPYEMTFVVPNVAGGMLAGAYISISTNGTISLAVNTGFGEPELNFEGIVYRV